MQTMTISNQTFSFTHSERAALKAVDGRKSRVFSASKTNLNRLGYAIYDLAAEVQPIITHSEETPNIVEIKRGEKLCRVYFTGEGFWNVEMQKLDWEGKPVWSRHPAISLACSMYAREALTKTSLEIGIRRSGSATPKHVFMALMGLNQAFVVVGKKADIQAGIIEGILKMASSPEGSN